MASKDNAALEVWKVTIEVQKHFNDLSMRVRGIAVTVLGAFLAAAGYALKEHKIVEFGGASVSLAGLILTSAFICWFAFFLMDRLWYHRLLKAAVMHGRKVETALETSIPVIGLTRTIDAESPLFGLRAGHRLSAFYMVFAVVLILAAGVAFGQAIWALIFAGALSLIVMTAELYRASKRGTNPSSKE